MIRMVVTGKATKRGSDQDRQAHILQSVTQNYSEHHIFVLVRLRQQIDPH